MFDGSAEFLKSAENQRKMLQFAQATENLSAEMMRRLEILSLYKAACIEHKKIMASPVTPDMLKRTSALNIHTFEKEMRARGITDDMMREALTQDDYDKRILHAYTEKMRAATDEFARKNGLTVSAENTPEKLMHTTLFHSGEDEAARMPDPQKVSSDDMAVYGLMAASGVPYFKTVPETYLKPSSSDYGKEPYKYFSLVNGEYKENPYPKGFFAKISYFFTKLSDRAKIREEKEKIERDAEKEKELFAEAEDGALEQATVADLTASSEMLSTPAVEESAEFTEQLGHDAEPETTASNDGFVKGGEERPAVLHAE